MKNILDELFYEHINKTKNSNLANETYFRLDKNEKYLKSHLNKKERKLLLRIIDDNLISEKISSTSFIEGFKLGLRIGYESNKD